MRSREGHRKRLREKFLRDGLEKFTDEDVIELLLTLATPRRDCKGAARLALKKFGTFSETLEASIEDLTSVKGIGPSNAFGIKFIHEVARKFLRDRALSRRALIDSFEALYDFYEHSLRRAKVERIHAMYLNAASEAIEEELVSHGGPSSAALTPRRIISTALKLGASAVTIAHNHPAGSASPSESDLGFTKSLVFALGMVDIELREHLIISKRDFFSFRLEGLIARFEDEFESFVESLSFQR